MRKITFGTSPTFYGKDNITTAFLDREIGFELEIRDKTSVQRNIISLKEALELKKQVENAIDVYLNFVKNYEEPRQ